MCSPAYGAAGVATPQAVVQPQSPNDPFVDASPRAGELGASQESAMWGGPGVERPVRVGLPLDPRQVGLVDTVPLGMPCESWTAPASCEAVQPQRPHDLHEALPGPEQEALESAMWSPEERLDRVLSLATRPFGLEDTMPLLHCKSGPQPEIQSINRRASDELWPSDFGRVGSPLMSYSICGGDWAQGEDGFEQWEPNVDELVRVYNVSSHSGDGTIPSQVMGA